MLEAVQNMVSGYQRQNLDMAISAEVSKKATNVASEAVLNILEGVAVNTAEISKTVAETTGKGTTLNISA